MIDRERLSNVAMVYFSCMKRLTSKRERPPPLDSQLYDMRETRLADHASFDT